MRRGPDAGLGGEDFPAGERRGSVTAIDAGTVAATQRDGLTQLGVVDASVRHRKRLGQCGGGEPFDKLRHVCDTLIAHHSQRFGAHVMTLPGRARFGHGGDQCASMRRHPFVGDLRCRVAAFGGQDAGQHALYSVVAQDLDGLVAPGVALLGQRARFVFGFARFQGRLLRQREGLDSGRFAAVIVLKLLSQLGGASLDRDTATRPARHQFRGHADDLAHGSFTASTGGLGEVHTEAVDGVGFHAGVVHLRGRHDEPVQRLTIEGEPAAHPIVIEVRHLVGDRNMGVQIGVPGARIAMSEHRGDEPFGVDLSDTVGAGTGESGVVLQPLQHVGHRGLVSGLDLLGNLRRGNGP